MPAASGAVGNGVMRSEGVAGMIGGIAVATRGEALGHEMWLDEVFLDQVAAWPKAVKARFTHPGLSADGLGTLLGRVAVRPQRVGDVVRGDLRFVASAQDTPQHGDLADYVMNLAEESPEDFGTSIVFELDLDAEEVFTKAHTDADGVFRSPDPLNTENYPHVRLAKLHAVDVVDTPAANPEGLFSGGHGVLDELDAVLAYGLGLRDEAPDTVGLIGVHPDRVRAFGVTFRDRYFRTSYGDKGDLVLNGGLSADSNEGGFGMGAESTESADQLRAELTARGKEIAELTSAHEKALASLRDEHGAALSAERERVGAIVSEAFTHIDPETREDWQALASKAIADEWSADKACAEFRGAALNDLRVGAASVGANGGGANGEGAGAKASELDAGDASFDAAVTAYQKQHPESSYAEAVDEVAATRGGLD